MKKTFIILYILVFVRLSFAQEVILSKVLKMNANSEKILYKINPDSVAAEYLGEIEVRGFSDDDAKVFGMVYKKAKEIGANAFSHHAFETIDGTVPEFDAAHYELNLYYVSPGDFPKEDNVIYLIASPHKKQTIAVNKENIIFQPRTYIKRKLLPGENYTVSTKKFLGSSIKLGMQENQPVQFFQFSGFSVNSNPYGSAGINFKSGDITKLEQSYAQFLTTIYQYQK